MTDSDPSIKAQQLIPRSLDDIVRKNKELLRLEYVNFSDLRPRHTQIQISNLKGTFENAFCYKRITKLSPAEPICIVGYLKTESGKIAYHTSEVVSVDVNQMAISTASGSNYLIDNLIDSDQIDSTLLLHICHVSHRDGWGPFFGTSNIFY